MSREPTAEEMNRAVEYARGELDERARMDLERDMAADPELAAEVERLLEMDALLEEAGRRGLLEPDRAAGLAAPGASVPPWIRGALAAAVLVLAVAGLGWLATPRSSPAVRLALLEGAPTPEAFLAEHEGLRGLEPPWAHRTRSGGEPASVAASEFVTRARAAERPAGERPPASGLFLLRVESAASRAVVVVGVPEAGSARRLYPDGPSRALPAGEHVLPAPRFRVVEGPDGEPAVAHERGWVVPPGARSLAVWVATRREPAGAELLDELDRALAAGEDPAALLAARGFDLQRIEVPEPTDG